MIDQSGFRTRYRSSHLCTTSCLPLLRGRGANGPSQDGGECLPVPAAAHRLGVKPGTLRRWIRRGCPTVSPGRKGRGHACLVNLSDVQQWLKADQSDALLLELASALPEVMATASAEAWRQIEGSDKRRLAGILAATWYVLSCAVLDHLRAKCPEIPEVAPTLPEPIERLRKIAQK